MKSTTPNYTELTLRGGTKIETHADPYGITFDGETGDYREEVWSYKNETFTVAISREFGFEEVVRGNHVGQLKRDMK